MFEGLTSLSIKGYATHLLEWHVWQQAREARPLRLLSANLWTGGANSQALKELVRTHAPDVVIVQELVPEQADELGGLLPYCHFHPRLDRTGMGVALRRKGTVERLPMAYCDGLVTAAVPDSGQVVTVTNVHFQAPSVPPPWRTFRQRRDQLAAIEQHLAGNAGRPHVVAGDFNSTPIWPAYKKLARHLRDAALDVARQKGVRPRATWGPWATAPRLLRLDHVMIRGIEIRDFRVLALPGSDHCAVAVELELPQVRAVERPGESRRAAR